MKTICPLHRFMYSGAVCPLCEKERIERLAKRYNPKVIEKQINEQPITEEDLKILIQKYKKH